MKKKEEGRLQEKKLLAVIDVQNPHQAMRNVRVAHDCGLNGVFLANFDAPESARHAAFAKAKETYPDFWIGVTAANCTAPRAIENYRDADAVWTLSPAFDPQSGLVTEKAREAAKRVHNYQHRYWTHGSYFGSISMSERLSMSALGRNGRLFDTFVLCASRRNQPPDPIVIRNIRALLGTLPLAVSGIFHEPIDQYLEVCDVLILSRRERSGHLSPVELSRLVKCLRH